MENKSSGSTCASGKHCRNPKHVLTNNHKCFRCHKPLGVECAAINAEDVPFDKFGDDAGLYSWEKRDVVICFLCLADGETANRLGRTVLADGIQQAPPVVPDRKRSPTVPVVPNRKPSPTVPCGKRSCKSGGIGTQCAFPTCPEYRCIPCNVQFFAKREWPLLYDDANGGEMIVACTKKHYSTVLKNLDPSSSRVPWNTDGPKGHDDPVNSETLLVEWLCTEGNYAKYRGSDNGGKTKIAFAQDISNMLQRRGIRTVRTPKQVLDKITTMEKRFREAFDLAHRETGAGLKKKNDGSFEEALVKKFRYYFDLLPIIADRASAKPSVTSDEHRNGHGYLSEEDEEEKDDDDSQSKTQTTGASILDDEQPFDDNEDYYPEDLLDHGDKEPGAEVERGGQDVVDATPRKDNTESVGLGRGLASTEVGAKKRRGVATSSKKKVTKKRGGTFKIDHSLLIDSDDDTHSGGTETKLAIKGRLKKAEMDEQKRHNLEMETIQRENNKWENKQKELAYKQQLWTQFTELEESGLDREQIVAIFPDMADFWKKT